MANSRAYADSLMSLAAVVNGKAVVSIFPNYLTTATCTEYEQWGHRLSSVTTVPSFSG